MVPFRLDDHLDVPDERTYDSTADERLDETLAEAIALAEEADNVFLATLLEFLLGSHYYSTR